jgi:hypothetical protein
VSASAAAHTDTAQTRKTQIIDAKKEEEETKTKTQKTKHIQRFRVLKPKSQGTRFGALEDQNELTRLAHSFGIERIALL